MRSIYEEAGEDSINIKYEIVQTVVKSLKISSKEQLLDCIREGSLHILTKALQEKND